MLAASEEKGIVDVMVVHWTIVDEIRLLRWASEFKPAGIHKHFHMFCIVERMNSPDKYPVTLLQKETMKLGKVFTAKDIWDKLSQSYNLEKIDEMENTYSLEATTESSRNGNGNGDDAEIHEETLLELNNRIRVRKQDFTLPWEEYGELILENARKSPNSNEEYPRVEDMNEKDSTIPKESLSTDLKNDNNKQEKNATIKVKELPEYHTEENDSPIDVQKEPIKEVQSDEKELQREHMSEEEQKMKSTNKTAAPVRKSQRLKRSKEVKFEDEEKEEIEEDNTKDEEQKEKKEEIREPKITHNEEVDKEKNENEEGDDEREKSTSYENTNGSESEGVDEGVDEELGYESEREAEGKGKQIESEGGNLKKKTENKKGDDQQDDTKKDSKDKNEPLAKRTRHSSSTGNTSNETSPKRKRRKAGSRKNSPPATRVSSRLRNKK